jgi:hypothetical protein
VSVIVSVTTYELAARYECKGGLGPVNELPSPKSQVYTTFGPAGPLLVVLVFVNVAVKGLQESTLVTVKLANNESSLTSTTKLAVSVVAVQPLGLEAIRVIVKVPAVV